MSAVLVLAVRAVIVTCAVLLVVLVVLDAQAERFTAGLTPLQFRGEVAGTRGAGYADVFGVAHNAGDDVGATHEAAAYGADAIEIDVTSVAGELHASHDAPVPFLDALFFRGPELEEAWEAPAARHGAARPEGVLAGLPRGRPALPRGRRDRRLIVQSRDARSLRVLRRTVPWARRLQLVFTEEDLEALRRDPGRVAELDGVSVRDHLLTAPGARVAGAAGPADVRVDGQRRPPPGRARPARDRRRHHRPAGLHGAARRPARARAMRRRRRGARPAAQELALAVVLVGAVELVGANFVLVEVRLPGLAFETRLGWVMLVSLLAGFAAGAVWMSRRR
jgi:hypothetical protein